MSLSPHAVLAEVVDRYDRTGEPVAARELRESLDVSGSALDQPLDSLCEFELLERTARGYRPTVTGRELLALDIELEDVLVLDLVDADGDGAESG